MFKRTQVCSAVIVALGAATAAPHAMAQAASQRIEITGSAIKRTNTEGPAPVEVITRKEIERTGATSLNELLRSIPSLDIFDQGELASNSPAGSGTASVRLRGLSDSETLVLLNGRRVPVNALYDSSGAGAAFDINSLPIGAIERIEILKDGASAIYGADAVAGVVNFITRTDYEGVEVSASYGTSSRSDGTEKRFGLSAGFGDLSKDKFNVLFGLDVFKRDPILRKDRDISRTVDYRRFPGGRDGRSSFGPSGNILDPNNGYDFAGVSYRPCPPEAQGANGICRYDFNASLLTAYNGADRTSALGVGTVQVTPNIKAFVEVTASTSKDTFFAHPVPDFFVVPIIDPSQNAYELPADLGLGAGKLYIAGRFMQGGPRTTQRKSDFTNAAVGTEGFNFGLDWKLSLSHGISKVTNSDSNYYNADLWFPATSGGQLDPTVNTNSPALVESLKVRPFRVGKSTLTTVTGLVSGSLFKLDGGDLKYAVGFSHNTEKLVDTPDELSQAGKVVGSIQQAAVNAQRENTALFAELQVPVLKNLEGQLAVRYDKYPAYSNTSPKVAIKYTPISSVAVRASYTESFRAPVLKQLFGAREEGAITITTPSQCRGLGVPVTVDPTTGQESCTVNGTQVNGSNPNLKPEQGKTYNLGVVFEPSPIFSASVDWWKIKKSDDISSPTISAAIEAGLFARVGARYFVFTNLQNIAERENSGVDLDARLRLRNTPAGNLTLRNLLTYYTTQKSRSSASDEFNEFLGTYAAPKYRNNFSVGTELGVWSGSASLRTVAGFWDTDEPEPVAAGTRKVKSHNELDLQVQYSGFKGLELNFGIKNALDKEPPLSLTNALDNSYTQMGFAELYSARGRFFYVGAKYAF